ncbi:tRNA (5-methylaminomethyl-2-thiouridine)(34)-methyltransferase MnmD [Mangrovicoccus algicola]|uniref:tRNA (5-methylaminomethyl-2-thiouridine)(34)-methyltransferase MnmD n=1 Tax=Mangrovicoccus algicola TaxID=2771008 RepID=A0A8J7CYW8_9RHOB|nr:tRNA (5-methylaminomethyl-2-thiouridine)(34)-methyltransferase MnmD [Mangrovicoccus algicola]MBE3640092.1 tRNA (5-methylaminomethyl-2-thiouridine)(34)-methyltransferase MnmD [Mangrovicoccus algicola]
MPDHQQAEITWRDGAIPVSRRFDDPYYSLDSGWQETAHVFLAGNGLPGRLRPGFRVAELGFGTGLNLLALVALAARTPSAAPLRYTSFELFPMSAEDMVQALAHFPEAAALAAPMIAARERDMRAWAMGGVEVELVLGDARETLPAWQGRADAWFLDGFAPAKNPELWEPALLEQVARHTAPGGSFATYTAAGAVRAALAQAGFAVERVPGFGRKRHMTVGTLP